MTRQTEAITPWSWSEKLFLLVLLAGSAWCALLLQEARIKPRVALRREAAPTSHVSAEWNEIREFKELPLPETFSRELAVLDGRVAAQLRKNTLELDRVRHPFPLLLYPLNDFSDYDITPSLPQPGSVVKLVAGNPQCIQFKWTKIPVKGVQYTLEIAKKKEMAIYRSFGASANVINVEVHRTSDFFWRVKATLGRTTIISPISSFLVTEPDLSEESKRLRSLASRVRNPSASLADLRYCRRP